jgi:hypothetical protein
MSITYAVGGAGAQAELARDILQSLSGALREGRMRLNLVAGVRAEVEQYFRRIVSELRLEAELGQSIRLLLAPTKDEYFAKFNQLLYETDVLWTKPSELCFYAALGIPLVMSAPLGAHEERNLETILRLGAGSGSTTRARPLSGSPTGQTTACLRSTPSRAISTCRAWVQRTSSASCSRRTARRL